MPARAWHRRTATSPAVAQIGTADRARRQQGRRASSRAHRGGFHELGVGEPLPISAAHGENVRDLIDIALEKSGTRDDKPDDDEADGERRVRVAVVGRPNVGKSTLVNSLLGEERVIAFDEPGTARRDSSRLRARRAPLHGHRHRRRAPPRQVSKRSRNFR
jgi:GTPase Era involved in 16S rRNA processing